MVDFMFMCILPQLKNYNFVDMKILQQNKKVNMEIYRVTPCTSMIDLFGEVLEGRLECLEDYWC